jgi:ribosomal protein S18 acetylase RimI-like enzyme
VSPGLEQRPDARFFAHADPDDVLVAEEDGAVAGYVQVEPATPLATNAHVLEIHGLVVDPARRRRGIARALLDAAAEHARARGARRLRLRVLAPNTGAIALYRACGYEQEGLLRDEFLLDGRYVDDVLMVLTL